MAEKRGKAAKAAKVPANVGAAVDLLDRMRDARKLAASKVEQMKRDEDALELAIFDKFKKQELEGARGRAAQASVSRSEVPTADDWEQIDKYITKNKALDLFQRRLSLEAVRARWADGVAIPGVGKFTKVSLHLSKVKAKKAAAPAGRKARR